MVEPDPVLRRSRLHGHGGHDARGEGGRKYPIWVRSGPYEQPKIIESSTHRIGREPECAGQHPEVPGTEGEHPSIEVLALQLDHADESAQDLRLGTDFLLEPGQVDGDSPEVTRPRPARRAGIVSSASSFRQNCVAVVIGRQQLIDRQVVEPGQPLEPGNGNDPITPLVGSENRRPHLPIGHPLDVLQGESHLVTQRTESGTQRPHIGAVDRLGLRGVG